MQLHERDYTYLTDEERAEWQSLQKQEVVKVGDLEVSQSRFRDYPKAARHFTSLFPNQYLDIVELEDEARLNEQLDRFRQLLDEPQVNERAILKFINKERAHFIIGSILNSYYSFGHHDAYMFPEFPLGTTYKLDYLLTGKSSDGWSFIFVELESPNGSATLSNGELGSSFRKGLNQIADWDAWLDGHFPSLAETFNKCKRKEESLPREFVEYDKTRIHYVVVAGRRNDFLERTYRTRRKRMRDNAELLLHYDNVVEAAKYVIGRNTY